MKCKICEQRKPRRYCPGVSGDICSICCGNEREQSINCPLECEYLQEAHDHERAPVIDPKQIPNRDIRLAEDFAHEHGSLLQLVLAITYRSALDVPDTIDSDVQQALESTIRTLRALDSGLYYEGRPENPLAASIHTKIREGLDELRQHMEGQAVKIRDSDFLAAFVYAQRETLFRNNGRRKCRAFLELLHRMFPEVKASESASPLIIS